MKATLGIIMILVTSFVSQAAMAQNQYTIIGAGATFPFPLIDLWRVKYNEEHPNIILNYQSIGSGGGVKQHIEKTVNFAASDAPLTAGELKLAPDSMHIPETIGGITVSYNLPEVPQSGLRLTGQQVANIFQGKISKWNDPQIQQNNPELNLPDKAILVVHRSDGSGTTFAFTEYLSMVSQDWSDQVGFGKSVPWPAGIGAAGNEGVATAVRTTPYSIGYVELAYAFQNDMSYAYIQNADGTAFIEPTLETLAAAAAGASSTLPASHESWEGVSINNAPGENSYPITSFTYILLHQNLEQVTKSKEHAMETVNLIKWMITDGQKYSPELLYVPIPAEITQIGLQGLDRVTYDGQPLSGKTAVSEQVQQTTGDDSAGGGCLIATATYGSELSPQVQMLREVRDGVLLKTVAGSTFMSGFNNIYYSFSPTVADWERQNPAFKELIKGTITPMLLTMSTLNHVEIDSEQKMLTYGVGLILLNVGVYFVAPAIIILKLRQTISKKMLKVQ